MHCLEFRRSKLADPRRRSLPEREHAAHCASCRVFEASIDRVEARITRACTLPLPAGLLERMIEQSAPAQRTDSLVQRTIGRWVAAAAPAFVVVALLIAGWHVSQADGRAREAIVHVLEEPPSAAGTAEHGMSDLAEAVGTLGGTLRSAVGTVRELRVCLMDDHLGWHLVLDTAEGEATVLLVPGKTLRVRGRAATRGWSALARPAGQGYIAVLSRDDTTTERVAMLLLSSIEWPEEARADPLPDPAA